MKDRLLAPGLKQSNWYKGEAAQCINGEPFSNVEPAIKKIKRSQILLTRHNHQIVLPFATALIVLICFTGLSCDVDMIFLGAVSFIGKLRS